jgi:hypothetical protein
MFIALLVAVMENHQGLQSLIQRLAAQVQQEIDGEAQGQKKIFL